MVVVIERTVPRMFGGKTIHFDNCVVYFLFEVVAKKPPTTLPKANVEPQK